MSNLLRARRAVQTLKEYHPPLGGRDGLRLDFNENVDGCSPRVLQTLHSITSETLNKYPEREPGERAVARHLGIPSEQVLLTNGVDEAIHLLAETYLEPGDEALIAVPTFSMYEIYALATGAAVRYVQSGEALDFPAFGLMKAITEKTRLICVANPNNPTGAIATREQLLAIVRAAPQAAVLIDEAYIHFGGESLLDELGQIDNLFISRTFSKAHGLAGFRLGALLGSTGQLKMLRRVASPYNVNGIALTCLAPHWTIAITSPATSSRSWRGGSGWRASTASATFRTGLRRRTLFSPTSATIARPSWSRCANAASWCATATAIPAVRAASASRLAIVCRPSAF